MFKCSYDRNFDLLPTDVKIKSQVVKQLWNLRTNQGGVLQHWRSTTNIVFPPNMIHVMHKYASISKTQRASSNSDGCVGAVEVTNKSSRIFQELVWEVWNQMKRQLQQQCGVIDSKLRESVNRTRIGSLVVEICHNLCMSWACIYATPASSLHREGWNTKK